jgi:hypothetical protein
MYVASIIPDVIKTAYHIMSILKIVNATGLGTGILIPFIETLS